MTTARELIDSVEKSRRALLESVASFTEPQAAFRPAEGQWSVVEVLEHLYLAEISGVAKIWTALEDVRAGKAWSGSRPNAGKSIEDVVAATWKATEVAPPIATPHIGGPLRFWLAANRSLTALLAEIGAALTGIELEAVVFPHYLSGPLDARQRLEFLRFHIERHMMQIARIRQAPGYPA